MCCVVWMLGFDFGDHYGDFFGPSLEYGPNWIGTLMVALKMKNKNQLKQILCIQIYPFLRSLAKYARTKCRSKLRKWEVQV